MIYFRFLREHPAFLGFGLLAVALSGFGQTFFISLFGGQIREAFALSNAGFGLLYSTATLVSGLVLLGAGRLLDRLDLRLFTAIVVLGVAAGCGLMAGATAVWAVGVAMFLLRFFGQGLMTHMALTSMGRYFEADRGKAVSVAGLGMPLGEAVWPSAGVAVAAWVGWRQTWGLSAIFMGALALPVLLAFLRGHGGRKRRLRDRTAAQAEGGAGRQWTPGEVLRDPRFYLVMPAVLAAPFIVTALFFHQVPLAAAKGWDLSWLASSFVAFAATHVLGLAVFGPLVDRAGAWRLLGLFLAPMALGLLVVAASDHPYAAPLYLGLMGASMGGTGTLLGALWPELYGVAHLGAIRAVVQSAMVLATAVSPALVGWLIDAGVTMEAVALGLVGYIAAAKALAVAGMRWSEPRGLQAG